MQASIIPFRPLHAQSNDNSDVFVTVPSAFQSDNTENSAGNQFQEGWMISYIDILTLLLTLFVILLAMSHFSEQKTDMPKDRAKNSVAVNDTTKKANPADKIKPKEVRINSIQQALKAPEPKLQKVVLSDHSVEVSTRETAKVDIIENNNDILPTAIVIQQTQHASTPDVLARILPSQFTTSGINAFSFTEQEKNLVLLPESEQIQSVEKAATNTTVAVENIVERTDPESERHASNTVNLQESILEKLKQAASGTSLEIQQTPGEVNITISDDMLFPSGSEALTPNGIKSLNNLAHIINESGLQVSVEGHTDNTPIRNQQFKSNWELSAARATMVTRLLIEQQVDPTNIRAIGYADTRPRADNTTEQGRNMNRRVSIILLMPKSGNREQTAEM